MNVAAMAQTSATPSLPSQPAANSIENWVAPGSSAARSKLLKHLSGSNQAFSPTQELEDIKDVPIKPNIKAGWRNSLDMRSKAGPVRPGQSVGINRRKALDKAKRDILRTLLDDDEPVIGGVDLSVSQEFGPRGAVVIGGVSRSIRLDTLEAEGVERLNSLVTEVRNARRDSTNQEMSRQQKLAALARDVDRMQWERLQYSMQVPNWEADTWRSINVEQRRVRAEDGLHYVPPEMRKRALREIERNAAWAERPQRVPKTAPANMSRRMSGEADCIGGDTERNSLSASGMDNTLLPADDVRSLHSPNTARNVRASTASTGVRANAAACVSARASTRGSTLMSTASKETTIRPLTVPPLHGKR